jgi:hypothetical protein
MPSGFWLLVLVFIGATHLAGPRGYWLIHFAFLFFSFSFFFFFLFRFLVLFFSVLKNVQILKTLDHQKVLQQPAGRGINLRGRRWSPKD